MQRIDVIYKNNITNIYFAVGPVIADLEAQGYDFYVNSDVSMCILKQAFVLTDAPSVVIDSIQKKIKSDPIAYPWIIDIYTN